MNILAIETSCDDTSAAIVKNGAQILALETNSQIPEHNKYGGVFPEIAARLHCKSISEVVKTAVKNSGLSAKNIDAVAVTSKPGLVSSLLVGINFAKTFALARKIPLIPVNHLQGHIASLYVNNTDLKPPFLCLIVSGGHTCIVLVKKYTEFEILSKTRDDAAGECMDKIARELNLNYPGGKSLDKMAEFGDSSKYIFKTPKLQNDDFSFSGLKTSVKNLIHRLMRENVDIPTPDICASVRKNIVDYLSSNLFKIFYKNREILGKPGKIAICGGVSANSLLREELTKKCRENNLKFYMPELRLCGDNAAMIGIQAYYEFLAGNVADFSLNGKSKI